MYQEHFIDLCRLVDHQTWNETVFAAYGWKSDLIDEHPSGTLRRDLGKIAGVAPFAKFGEKQSRITVTHVGKICIKPETIAHLAYR